MPERTESKLSVSFIVLVIVGIPVNLRAVAYMYLGIAIRTCLSAGFNREVRNPKDQREPWISKTWW